jgi:hypothetical protein
MIFVTQSHIDNDALKKLFKDTLYSVVEYNSIRGETADVYKLIVGLNYLFNTFLDQKLQPTKLMRYSILGTIAYNATYVYSRAADVTVYDAVDVFSEVFAKRNHDYGADNIALLGEAGIVLRLTDKRERIRNITSKGESASEPLLDAYLDTANYCTIMHLVMNNKWPVACKHYRMVEYEPNTEAVI